MGENVRITITKMFRSLNLFDIIDKLVLVFVTDRQTGEGGSNTVAALRRFTNTALRKMGEENVTWKG
jgi:hypothetical protein